MVFVVIPLLSLLNVLGTSFEDVLFHKRGWRCVLVIGTLVLKRRLNNNSARLYPFSSGVLYASKASYGSDERSKRFTV